MELDKLFTKIGEQMELDRLFTKLENKWNQMNYLQNWGTNGIG